MNTDQVLRSHLLALLDGGSAHMTLDHAVASFPLDKINLRPPNVTYTPWHLVEHLRITQWDILEYMRDPAHVSPDWPLGYWPPPDTTTDAVGWQQTIVRFQADLRAVREIAADPAADLYAPIPHGYDGHTILREILLVADHNAYHIGELGILRQVMQAW